MTTRTYGQYCGLARAMEIAGERWTLLVIRDLLLGPKGFTELRAGLPRIPRSVLATRLNDLEQHGVLRRRVLPHLDAGVIYELTEYGAELDQILLQLALWGSRSLGDPAPDEVFTVDAAILSLHTTFRPEYAAGMHMVYELRYPGDIVVWAVVDDGTLRVTTDPRPDADLVLTPRGSIKPLLCGELSAQGARSAGLVELTGEPELLDDFVRLFHIPATPVPERGLAVH